MIKNFFKKSLVIDGLNVFWLGLLGFALSAFYLSGKMIDTGYPDWLYHAFRAQSIMQHGILSWDYIWDNGISYWRGYQMVPGLITAGTAQLLHVSATEAMMVLTVTLFTLFHIALYVCLRYLGRSPMIAATVSALSFAFSGYWVLVGFYSILFAVVLVPVMVMLWRAGMTSRNWRLAFATAIGLSIYVHPLLALSFGGLWVVTLFMHRREVTAGQALVELVIMGCTAFFYLYGLLFIDPSFAAPYQLQKNFLYTVGAALKFGTIFLPIVLLLAFAVIFVSQRYSTNTKYLFWYSALLYLIIEVNLKTGWIDWLNRYQVYRVGFFIGVALLIAFAEVLAVATAHWSRTLLYCLFALGLGVGIAQSLIDSSVYGFTPVAKISEPVGAYLDSHKAPLVGEIFISDSMPSSYYHPELHFSNGYNDQLLPQLANDRLRSLLSEVAPSYRVTPANIVDIVAYSKALGVGPLFLPDNSPYAKPLVAQAGYRIDGRVSGKNYDLAVLVPPWTPNYGVMLAKNRADALTGAPLAFSVNKPDAYFKALDSVIEQVAAIKYAPETKAVDVTFPAPDKLKISLSVSPDPSYVYVNQSYSKGWHISHGSISTTVDRMMLITVPAGVGTVYLAHTWGQAPQIQFGLWLLVGLYLLGAYVWGRRHA